MPTLFKEKISAKIKGNQGTKGFQMAKILLVEDNETNSEMLTRRLLKKNYEVIHAKDGEEGLAKAENEEPDLILMDLSLPRMDGWEASRRIKANPKTKNIPIIALTAHAMVGDRDKALAAGCDDYDTKPIEFPRLITKIEYLLQHKVIVFRK